jgi:glycosyltransferase involved in cell wall biosynthesis
MCYNLDMSKNKEKRRKVYKIGIDARFFGLENKGLGRYTNELVEWLDELIESENLQKQGKLSDGIEYYIFLRKNNFDDYQPKSDNIHKVEADYDWYSWGEQLKFPFLLKRYKLDLMHFTHFNAPILYGNNFIVTIHDLILFHYPTIKNTTLNKLSYFFKLVAYHLAIRITVRRANSIIAISKFTKKDVVQSLGVTKDKINVIYEGAEFSESLLEVSIDYQEKKNAIFKKYGIIKTQSKEESAYLLYVGNAYPHKNLERLILAFSQLNIPKGDKLQLVLVGKKDYFYKKLGEFISENKIKNIIITDYISDEDLNILYKNARFFVFPSLYEGFGLPPLEALVKGLAVISSGESSLVEILDNKVKYFNPRSVDSMSEGISKMLARKQTILSATEIKKIKKKYSWKKMTKETIRLFRKKIIEIESAK